MVEPCTKSIFAQSLGNENAAADQEGGGGGEPGLNRHRRRPNHQVEKATDPSSSYQKPL